MMPDIPPITDKIDGRPCWERLTGEREKAFAAFQFYRDLGPARTIPDCVKFVRAQLDEKFKLQERLTKQDTGQFLSSGQKHGRFRKDSAITHQLYDWSTTYAWKERADYYDRHMDHVRIKAAEDAVSEMVKTHLKVATKAITIAEKKFDSILEDEGVRARDLAPEVALRYAVEGTKIERLTRGESTENTTVKDGRAAPAAGASGSAREIIQQRLKKIRDKNAEREESDTPETQTGQKPSLTVIEGGQRKEA